MWQLSNTQNKYEINVRAKLFHLKETMKRRGLFTRQNISLLSGLQADQLVTRNYILDI